MSTHRPKLPLDLTGDLQDLAEHANEFMDAAMAGELEDLSDYDTAEVCRSARVLTQFLMNLREQHEVKVDGNAEHRLTMRDFL